MNFERIAVGLQQKLGETVSRYEGELAVVREQATAEIERLTEENEALKAENESLKGDKEKTDVVLEEKDAKS